MKFKYCLFYIPLLCLSLNYQHLQAQNKPEKPSSERFLNWVIKDPYYITKDLNKKDAEFFLLTGLGITGISTQDAITSTSLQSRFRNNTLLAATNEVGTFKYVGSLSAVLFGTSLLTDNHKFQDAAFTSLQSLIYTKFTVGAAKYAFARERPYEAERTHDFEFFENNVTSFPSGHTSTAFALVVPWVIYYPNAFTYSLLALPVGTAIARVSKGKHWMSDVAAGAAIGAYWSYKLSKRHHNISRQDNIEITPFVGTKSGGLTLNISF